MTIVDTSVWVDYLNDRSNLQTEWLYSTVGSQTLGLTDLILSEVLQGIRYDLKFRQVQQQLARLELFKTGGKSMAVASALNYRKLRSKGHSVRSTIDCLIATLCIEKGFQLLHRDRDFDAFERHLGLQVVHPRAQ